MEKTVQKFEISFSWRRHGFGYKWENAKLCSPWGEAFNSMDDSEREKYQELISSSSSAVGPFLVEKTLSILWVGLEPLANALLFAQFSDIIPTEESFLDWANENGRLVDIENSTELLYDFILAPYTPRDEQEKNFELSIKTHRIVKKDGLLYRITKPDSLSFWKQEHRDLSFAVMLWEMISNDDPRLNDILEWNGNRAYAYPFSRDKLDLIDFERLKKDSRYQPNFVLPPRRIEGYHPQKFNAKKAASRYIQQELNKKIRLYPLIVRFETDNKEEVHKIIQPTSLLSAMWYQLFLALSGDIRLRRCSLCKKWENMEGHRETWSKHANCANYDRVKKSRLKKRGKADEI
jgi:hypothetical protein